MTTNQEISEPEDTLEGEPTVSEIVEFSIAVSLDLENGLDEEQNPFEVMLTLNVNAGMLLYMAYLVQDMYQAMEDMSEEDMVMMEEYVKAKKRTPNNSNLMH